MVSVLYAPGGYYFSPELGPWAIQAFLEEKGVECDVFDLNSSFYKDLWTSDEIQKEIRDGIALHGTKADVLACELISREAKAAYDCLRDIEKYSNPRLLRESLYMLKLTDLLFRKYEKYKGLVRDLPSTLGSWSTLMDNFSRYSPMAHWIDEWVGQNCSTLPDLVGISCAYRQQLLPGLYLARKMKQANSSTLTVIGGSAVTHYINEISTDPSFFEAIDFAVPFEGEHLMLEIYRAVEKRVEVSGILNVAYLGDHGEVIYRRDLMKTSHAESSPTFRGLQHFYPTPSPLYPVLTSKGCYWGKCAFCTHHEGYGRGYQRFSDQTVVKTLDNIASLGGEYIYFVDEALPPRKLHDLADYLATSGRNIKWMAEARLEKILVSEDAVHLLKRSGCKLLINGIEAGSQRVLDLMKKGINLELVAEHARLCKLEGVRTGWMFFVGFPGESLAESRETFEFILRNSGNVDFASVGSFILERGSPISESPSEYGISEMRNIPEYYPDDVEYVFSSNKGNAKLAANLRKTLAAEFPDLRSIFSAALERSLFMFVPISVDLRIDYDTQEVDEHLISFHSDSLNTEVKFRQMTGQFEMKGI